MFIEVYTQPFSNIRQSPIGGMEKHVRIYIIFLFLYTETHLDIVLFAYILRQR